MAKKRSADFPQDAAKLQDIVNLIPEDRREVGRRLANEIQFMGRTLERLRGTIDDGGVTDDFKQGKQEFIRENPALKSYTNLVPKYSAAFKQLLDMLPAAPLIPQEPDELEKFMQSSDAK